MCPVPLYASNVSICIQYHDICPVSLQVSSVTACVQSYSPVWFLWHFLCPRTPTGSRGSHRTTLSPGGAGKTPLSSWSESCTGTAIQAVTTMRRVKLAWLDAGLLHLKWTNSISVHASVDFSWRCIWSNELEIRQAEEITQQVKRCYTSY